MKTVAVFNLKGGVGCSYLADRFAHWLANKGDKVVVIMNDVLSKHDNKDVEHIIYNKDNSTFEKAFNNIKESIDRSMDSDYVILDVDKRDYGILFFSLLREKKIDYCIIPTDDDTMAISDTTMLEDAISRYRLPHCVVLNRITEAEVGKARRTLAALNLPVLASVVIKDDGKDYSASEKKTYEQIYNILNTMEPSWLDIQKKKRRIQ